MPGRIQEFWKGGGRTPSNPHHQTGWVRDVCSRPEDGLRYRQGVTPPLKLKHTYYIQTYVYIDVYMYNYGGSWWVSMGYQLTTGKITRPIPGHPPSYTLPGIHYTWLSLRFVYFSIQCVDKSNSQNTPAFGTKVEIYLCLWPGWLYRCVSFGFNIPLGKKVSDTHGKHLSIIYVYINLYMYISAYWVCFL